MGLLGLPFPHEGVGEAEPVVVADVLGEDDVAVLAPQRQAGGRLAAPDGTTLAHLPDHHAAVQAHREGGDCRAEVLALEAFFHLTVMLVAQRLEAGLQLGEGERHDPAASLAAAFEGDALPPLGFGHVFPPLGT